MPASNLQEQVRQALERGATVLTSNQRAARALRAGLNDAHVGESQGEVMPWSAWVGALWQRRIVRGAEERVLLNDAQQVAVWQAVLPVQFVSMARLAKEAASIVDAWQIRGHLKRQDAASDAAHFMEWLPKFEKACAAKGWMAASGAEAALATALSHQDDLPREILLVGFDGLLPSQRRLMDALVACGVVVTEAAAGPEGSLSVARCANEEDEIAQCAAWVAAFVKDNATARVAIVVPDPDEVRPLLERALVRQMNPALQHVDAPRTGMPFEFSLGTKLTSHRMVRDALQILRWCVAPLGFEDASALLRSAYIGSAEEDAERAAFDVNELRKPGRWVSDELPLDAAVMFLKGDLKRAEHPLHWALAALLKERESLRRRSWTEWGETFQRLLAIATWPGTRSEDSLDYQLRQRWIETLEQMAHLDVVSGAVDLDEALRMLETMAAETLFAPQSLDARVQVLGPLEAAGSEFDAIWFLRADETRWPVTARPHPLLPFFLQREHGLPSANPAAAKESATSTTERLLRSAPIVIASYSEVTETGEAQRPSSLLRARGTAMSPIAMQAEDIAAVKRFEDTDALPRAGESVLRGGAHLLEAMAACPFRAFAEIRLASSEPRGQTNGLDAIERGDIIHSILHLFWNEVKTRDELARLSSAAYGDGTERDALLRRQISQVLSHAGTTAWEKAYLEIEKERVFHLLSRWLDEELKRPSFAVEAMEKKLLDVRLGPLRLELRLDRVDLMKDDAGQAARVLIDYKTGRNAKVAGWEGERPDLPQLPLYAVAGGLENVRGIAFASLFNGKDGLKFKGISSPSSLLGLAKSAEYDESAAAWKTSLLGLAEEFAAGVAHVDPKRDAATCRMCGQRVVCRISTLQEEDDEEPESE